MKILSVVGARPNFVKVAPLLAEMRRYPDIRSVVVHTGQHRDEEMSGSFLRDLRIPPPEYVLNGDRAPAALPAEEMASALAPILRAERPDLTLVVGDVNSTLAGALAAAQLGIPVAHVEAGLRSFDPSMPEERNRILTDALSSQLFASEPSAVRNLLAEGQPAGRVFLTGNVMIDSLRRWSEHPGRPAVLERLGLAGGAPEPYVLATFHRPAAVDDPAVLRGLWEALRAIGERARVVFPVHPRTRRRLGELGLADALEGGAAGAGICLLPPLPYPEFLHLERRAALAITDSGGVQEETTAFGVPCLTARNNTERPITISEGTNQLVGLDPARILEAALRILSGERKPGRIPRLWDGRSAGRIVRILHRRLGGAPRPSRFAFSPAMPAPASLPALGHSAPAAR